MHINLGGAVAGAATAISVLDEYFQELYRIERIPRSIPLSQGVVGPGLTGRPAQLLEDALERAERVVGAASNHRVKDIIARRNGDSR